MPGGSQEPGLQTHTGRVGVLLQPLTLSCTSSAPQGRGLHPRRAAGSQAAAAGHLGDPPDRPHRAAPGDTQREHLAGESCSVSAALPPCLPVPDFSAPLPSGFLQAAPGESVHPAEAALQQPQAQVPLAVGGRAASAQLPLHVRSQEAVRASCVGRAFGAAGVTVRAWRGLSLVGWGLSLGMGAAQPRGWVLGWK